MNISIIVPYREIWDRTITCLSYLELDEGDEILFIQNEEIPNEITKRKLENIGRVIPSPNLGSGKARMKGIKEAKGDYIAFIDADDTFPYNYISSMKEKAETGYDLVIGQGWLRYPYLTDLPFDWSFNTKEEFLDKYWSDVIGSQVWGKLYRKELIEDIVMPDGLYEDVCFNNTVLTKNPNLSVIYEERAQYFWYRSNPDAMTYERHSESSVISALENLTLASSYVPKDKINLFKKKYAHTVFSLVRRLGLNSQYELHEKCCTFINYDLFDPAEVKIIDAFQLYFDIVKENKLTELLSCK